jgi:hypothetical protein
MPELTTASDATFGLFLGGCDRSGTTLLQAILNAHPEVLITYELVLAIHLHGRFARLRRAEVGNFVDAVLAVPHFSALDRQALLRDLQTDDISFSKAVTHVHRELAAKHGKKVWGDKNPGYARRFEFLAATFPRAKLIHIHRNPYDVIPSIVRQAWGPNTALHAAVMWQEYVGRATQSLRRLGPACSLTVCYEELVRDPKTEVERICSFLGIAPHDAMFDPGKRQSTIPVDKRLIHPMVGQAITAAPSHPKRELTDRDIEIIDRICGDLMDELGYPQISGLGGRGVPFGDRIRYALTARLRRHWSKAPRSTHHS